MSHSCSHKILRVLLKIIQAWCVCLGLLPPKLKRFKHSKLALCYSIFINLIMMGTVISLVPIIVKRMHGESAMINIISTLFAGLVGFLLCVTLITYWTHRFQQIRLIADAFKLHEKYYQKKSFENEYFARYVIIRYLHILFRSSSTFCALLAFNPYDSYVYYLIIIIFYMILNAMLAIEMQFDCSLIYICSFIEQLNKDLNELWKQLNAVISVGSLSKQQTLDLAHEIDLISSVYLRLLHLSKRLIVVYQWPMIFTIFNLFIINLVCSFEFLVYLTGKYQFQDFYSSLIFAPLNVFLSTYNLWIFFHCCERWLNSSRQLRQTLTNFNEHHGFSYRITRSLEIMDMRCSIFSDQIRICGLFDLNNSTWHTMIMDIIFSLIVLVQYDYKNLY